MTILSSRASSPRVSVVGPGMDSANANSSAFSSRQKYWERKSSCRQTICAPPAAASRIRQRAFSRFSLGSAAQLIWTRPTRNLPALGFCIVLLCRTRGLVLLLLGPHQETQRHLALGADQS